MYKLYGAFGKPSKVNQNDVFACLKYADDCNIAPEEKARLREELEEAIAQQQHKKRTSKDTGRY